MTSLFYFIFLFLVVFAEGSNIFSPDKKIRLLESIKIKDEEEKKEALKGLLSMLLIEVFYGLFSIIGLMTDQWVAFVVLFLLSIVVAPLKHVAPTYARILDGIISLPLGLFIVINYFHLHMDSMMIMDFVRSIF